MLEVSQVIGPPGWYHALVAALCVLRSFCCAWTVFLGPFVVPPVQHWCAKPPLEALVNWTEQQWRGIAIPPLTAAPGFPNRSVGLAYDSCHSYLVRAVHPNGSIDFDKENVIPCESWAFDEESSRSASAVPEWNLVCGNDWKRSVITSIAFFGFLAGGITMGHISDRFGRRPTLVATFLGTAVFSSVSAASPSVEWFLALRFFTSVCVAGIQTTSATIFAEILEARYRTALNVGFCLGFGLAAVCLPAVAYVIENWKWLQVAVGFSALTCLPLMAIIHESPRWLLTMHRTTSATAAIKRIFAINRRPLPNVQETVAELMRSISSAKASSPFGPVHILRFKRLRRHALCAFIHWFCDTFLLYTVAFMSVDLGGADSSYLVKFALSSAVELPGAFVAFAVVYFFRRRTSLIFVTLLGSAAGATSCSVPSSIPYLSLALNMTSRCLFVVTTGIKWVFTMEVFPTPVRSFGFAASFTVGRIGGILSPFTRDLMLHAHWTVVPAVLLAAGVISAVAVGFMPETLGIDLPDTFFQADQLGRRRSSSRSEVQLKTELPSEENEAVPLETC
ncbi:organic cation transporter protein-like isoform X1 [Haemaphysalis longicornis]